MKFSLPTNSRNRQPINIHTNKTKGRRSSWVFMCIGYIYVQDIERDGFVRRRTTFLREIHVEFVSKKIDARGSLCGARAKRLNCCIEFAKTTISPPQPFT